MFLPHCSFQKQPIFPGSIGVGEWAGSSVLVGLFKVLVSSYGAAKPPMFSLHLVVSYTERFERPWVSIRKWSNVGWLGGTPHVGRLLLWEEIYIHTRTHIWHTYILTSRWFSYFWTNCASFVSGLLGDFSRNTSVWLDLDSRSSNCDLDTDVLGMLWGSSSSTKGFSRSADSQNSKPNRVSESSCGKAAPSIQHNTTHSHNPMSCRRSPRRSHRLLPGQETERWLPLGTWDLGAGKGSSWERRFATWISTHQPIHRLSIDYP